ncbi:helix-turn-helix domain-containing protein [Deltaproteobacteria bacterium IMCC39524]|nr:helix-turn-helix domain-containing protein [Deltaproteobacteria bacterium IMCC39524]
MKSTDELLTIEQFAHRLGISRTTVFEWMKSGDLIQGQHYLKINRIIRFPWGNDLIQSLVTDSLDITPSIEIGPQTLNPKPPSSEGATIDLDYR